MKFLNARQSPGLPAKMATEEPFGDLNFQCPLPVRSTAHPWRTASSWIS